MSELTYEQKRELLNPAGKRYASVAEMVRERGDEEFAKELEAESSHLWIAVPAGMPLEESAICSRGVNNMEAGQIVEVVGYDSLYDGKRGVIKFVNHCYTDKERSMVTIVMSDGREYCFGNHFLKLVSEQLKL